MANENNLTIKELSDIASQAKQKSKFISQALAVEEKYNATHDPVEGERLYGQLLQLRSQTSCIAYSFRRRLGNGAENFSYLDVARLIADKRASKPRRAIQKQ